LVLDKMGRGLLGINCVVEALLVLFVTVAPTLQVGCGRVASGFVGSGDAVVGRLLSGSEGIAARLLQRTHRVTTSLLEGC
jgi:hypothetical protein